MKIRNIKFEDYENIDRLMQQLHKIHVSGRPDLFVDMEHPYPIGKFKELIQSENVIAVLAEEKENVVGLCIVEISERSMMVNELAAYIVDLIVDEEYRNRGIAKKIWSVVEAEAIRRGAKRLDLMVWSFNENAIKFYEEMGMKPQRLFLEKQLLK